MNDNDIDKCITDLDAWFVITPTTHSLKLTPESARMLSSAIEAKWVELCLFDATNSESET